MKQYLILFFLLTFNNIEIDNINNNSNMKNVEIIVCNKSDKDLLGGIIPVSLIIKNKTNHHLSVILPYPNPGELSFDSKSPLLIKKSNEQKLDEITVSTEISPGDKYEAIFFLNRYFSFKEKGKADISYKLYITMKLGNSIPVNEYYEGTFPILLMDASDEELTRQFAYYSNNLNSNNRKIKMEAAEALSFIDNPLCIDYITPMLSIENLEIIGINVLSRFNIEKVRKLIYGMLSYNDCEVVSTAIIALDSMKVHIPRIKFLDMLSSKDAGIRFIGLENLKLAPDINDKNYITPLFHDLDPIVAKKAKEYYQLISK